MPNAAVEITRAAVRFVVSSVTWDSFEKNGTYTAWALPGIADGAAQVSDVR